MLEDGMVRGGGRERYAITQIAIRRKNREPEQQRTEKPRPRAISISASHTDNDK
jgi:hypothetical protein